MTTFAPTTNSIQIKKSRCYVRVSTTYQVELGLSLEAQQQRCEAHALLNNMEVTKVYIDAGISGRSIKKRPGIQLLLAELEEGDTVIIYSLSRLGRSLAELLTIMDLLKQKKCHLVSLTENISTSSVMGNFVFQLFASLAEMESSLIGERVKLGLSLRAQKGLVIGRCPYGFTVKEGHLVKVPEEQRTIATIMKIRDTPNRFGRPTSLLDIIEELEKRGIEPRETSKKGWHINTIARIIKNATREDLLAIEGEMSEESSSSEEEVVVKKKKKSKKEVEKPVKESKKNTIAPEVKKKKVTAPEPKEPEKKAPEVVKEKPKKVTPPVEVKKEQIESSSEEEVVVVKKKKKKVVVESSSEEEEVPKKKYKSKSEKLKEKRKATG